MVYLGEEEGCKAHRLFDLSRGRLHVSRDVVFQENLEWKWNTTAGNEEESPEFIILDTLFSDNVVARPAAVMTNIPTSSTSSMPDETCVTAAAETVSVPPMTEASSPPMLSSNARGTKSLVSTTLESHDGVIRFRSVADIYANADEVATVDEEEVEVMMMISEEPTCYQEAATESCCDLAGDLDGRRSTSGMAFYLNESLVSCNSQKQKTVALSSYEAEFMAATAAACQALWLRSLVSELIGTELKPITLFVDNKSAIALMKNPVFHGRSKHIDTRYHFIRECVTRGQIVVEFINIGEQRADALTKTLSGVKLATSRQLLGVCDLESCQD
ncbi:hypothetical protein MLD38_031215 [Melastoma candidum]|uniref:Uncharacterized protein n=1 Tax=Melastoma candidum TaxID=119954 RepID=A0ACB9MP18_9MYRT|nr:hypothetical protein MLD38_031215 [Melastoma candidum]